MLVGQRLVIGALCSAVDAAAGGAGGVVLLAGETGMGKTALASEAVAYAKAQGAVAVRGTCWEGDGAPGFWPWIQVVPGLARDGSDAGEAVLAKLTGGTGARGGILDDESAVRFRAYDATATSDELAEADARHGIERSARLAAGRGVLTGELAAPPVLAGGAGDWGMPPNARAPRSRPGSVMPSAASSGPIPSSAGTCGPAS
jgi:RecA/RadA recombinase